MNRRVLHLFILTILIAIISTTCFILHVNGATLEVCKEGCKYPSVQTAAYQAFSGDTIEIKQGTYHENITINKEISIVGSAKDEVTIIPTSRQNSIFRVGPSEIQASLKNLTIAGGDTGIKVIGNASIRIENCRIMANVKSGIRLTNESQAEIYRTNIRENNSEGIILQNSATMYIVNSIMRYNPDGIILRDDSKAEIEHCKLAQNQLKRNSFMGKFGAQNHGINSQRITNIWTGAGSSKLWF